MQTDRKPRSLTKWGFLLSIFLIPSFLCFAFYYFFVREPATRHDSSIFLKLPYYGPKDVDANGDTIYHVIPSFSFINQDGKTMTDKDFDGKIYVAEFFFTTCKTICPKMSSNLFNVQTKLDYLKDFRILSHTVNPEEDSVPILKAYSNKVHADPEVWNFVTGEKKALYDLARHGYLVSAMEGDGGPDDFIHSENVVLVDREKRIRGFYDATSASDVNRLIDEVKVLVAEYKYAKRTSNKN